MRNAVKTFLGSRPLLRPAYIFVRKCAAHWRSIKFLWREVLPLILKTGKRPVAFLRYNALGDIICTFPAALELKKRHPNSPFLFLCRPDFQCLPRMGGITDYVAWPPHIKLIESRYFFLFSAIYKFAYSDENESSGSTESVIAEYCRQHDISVTDVHPPLHITAASNSRVSELLESHQVGRNSPLVVIHPGPSWHVREWPMKCWSQLVEELTGHGIETIIQLGSGKRGEVGAALDVELPGVLSLVNQLTIEESFALISNCNVFIGIDSGLLHGAACFGVPAIGVFGPTSPRLRFSAAQAASFVTSEVDCQGCHHRHPRLHWFTSCPFDIRCMKSIPVQAVLEKCLALIKPKMRAIQ